VQLGVLVRPNRCAGLLLLLAFRVTALVLLRPVEGVGVKILGLVQDVERLDELGRHGEQRGVVQDSSFCGSRLPFEQRLGELLIDF